jgi:outer membrane protein OmpA-like peptidoglycan-associated protein
MGKTFCRITAIVALLSLGGCAFIGSLSESESDSDSEQEATPIDKVATIEVATPDWESADPDAAPRTYTASKTSKTARKTTRRATRKTKVTVADPDDREYALAAHKQALEESGTTLPNADVGYYMDTHEARFIQLVRDDRVSMQRQGDSLALIISGGDSFDSNSAHLRREMDSVLNAIALVLEEYQDTRIVISGHTDDTGETDYNQRLSERRARAVASFLREAGVSAARIVILGYGEAEPIADNASADGRAANRRIEILLEPMIDQSSGLPAAPQAIASNS